MTNNRLLSAIRQELKNKVDLKYKKGAENFFREEIKFYGVRTPQVRKVSARFFLLIKDKDKKEILNLSEQLLQTGYFEEITIGLDWSFRIRKRYIQSDFSIFERWLKKYISNWANCDDFCGHLLGWFLLTFDSLIPKAKKWTGSNSRWVRRASAVIFIVSVRKGKYLKDVFEISNRLLLDKDDMVQKGYGWLLKEASNVFLKEVFDFVMQRKDKMPRIALRYAIEKMPTEMKKKATI